MITNFKLFENKEKLPIGEYVIVEPGPERCLSQDWRDFLKINVGKIVGKYYYTYKVEFKITIGTEILSFRAKEIIQHSKNREDLEYIEVANKYNL